MVSLIGRSSYLFARKRLSTGLPVFDRFLSPGLPAAGLIEIYGVEGLGKTALALQIAGAVFKAGGYVILQDIENALDGDRICHLWGITEGEFESQFAEETIDDGRIFVRHCQSLEDSIISSEERFSWIRASLSPTAQIVVVEDSVAAAMPNLQQNWNYGDSSQKGMQANAWTDSLRKLNPTLVKEGICWININHEKDKMAMGLMRGGHSTPGGRALKFFYGVRLRMQKMGEYLKVSDTTVGEVVGVTIMKHKWAPSHRSIKLPFVYRHGLRPDHVAFALLYKAKKIKGAKTGIDGRGPGTLVMDLSGKAKEIKFDSWGDLYLKIGPSIEKYIEKVGLSL